MRAAGRNRNACPPSTPTAACSAQDLVSALQVPPQDNSSMDGYAVRGAEIADEACVLPVASASRPAAAAQPLAAGTAARIFTGATVPEGADAVVMQEDTSALRGRPRAHPARAGRRPVDPPQPAKTSPRGDVVLARGERLAPGGLGLAASIGLRPAGGGAPPARRAVLDRRRTRDARRGGAGGDEAGRRSTTPTASSCAACCSAWAARCNDLGIVPDRRDATVQALRDAAAGNDLILTSGGVSVGEEDHIKPAVQQLGTLDLW